MHCPPKIVHVVESLANGGTERALVTLLNRFDRDHFDHSLITLRRAGPLAALLPAEVSCHALQAAGRARGTAFKLAGALRRLHADVVHARNVCCWADTIVAGALARVRNVVLGFHGFDAREEHAAGLRRCVRLGSFLGSHWTSVSVHGAEYLQSGHVQVDRQWIHVLENGVDVDRFAPPDVKQRERARALLGVPPDANLVVSVGRLSAIKRFDLLVGALARASSRLPLHGVIAGDGPERETLQGQIDSLGMSSRIRLTGELTDVRDCLAAADAFVCASDAEGISNAMLEAAAMGLPVVSTDVGDHGRLIRQWTCGTVVPAGDLESLAGAVTNLFENPVGRRTFGFRARSCAEYHSLDRMVAGYESFYARLVQGNRVGTRRRPAIADSAVPSIEVR